MTDSMFLWHYDGETALRRTPELRVEGEAFRLVEGDWHSGPFAFADLRFQGEQGKAAIYALIEDGEERDGWRLGIVDPSPELAGKLPRHATYGGWIDRVGLWRAVAAFAAISAVVLYVGLRSPEWVAPLVPYSWEQQMGEAIVGDLGGRFCHTPAGDRALAKLVDKLDGQPEDLKVGVVNVDIVNAAALPGGQIILFDGLIEEAKSPDEVAGVLAHEIGHVRERHVMQSLLRQLGLSVLLGGFDGDVGGTINGLLATSYGRDAEREADAWSIDALDAADVSPKPTADFFAAMARKEGKGRGSAMLGYLSSHPMSAERRDAFRDSLDKDRDYTPVLTKQEWRDLRRMCKEDPDVKGDGKLF